MGCLALPERLGGILASRPPVIRFDHEVRHPFSMHRFEQRGSGTRYSSGSRRCNHPRLKCAYHPGLSAVTLPSGHPFPISKSAFLKDIVLREGIGAGSDFLIPDPLGLDSRALVHTSEYLAKLDGPGLWARNSGDSACRGRRLRARGRGGLTGGTLLSRSARASG